MSIVGCEDKKARSADRCVQRRSRRLACGFRRADGSHPAPVRPLGAGSSCRGVGVGDAVECEAQELLDIAKEHRDVTPHGLQHMPSRISWDEDAIAGDVRDYVTTALADPDAVLVVDETGDLKKGTPPSVCNANTPAPGTDRELPSRGLPHLMGTGRRVLDGNLGSRSTGNPVARTTRSAPLSLLRRASRCAPTPPAPLTARL